MPCSYGQNLIKGIVVDSSGKVIPNVSVSYSTPGSTILEGFTMSDSKGEFSLPVKKTLDSITIILQHISYKPGTWNIKNTVTQHRFVLKAQAIELPNVTVSPPPIFMQKDTINYNVSAFVTREDRVIADIIRKLPGIEMDGDKILYKGMPIQKYFINGLDLLEGRYSIANNNLPVDAVQRIQLIENDQPIRILDSLVFSNKASLNIQLKKITVTGIGKIGTGLTPLLWDLNLTPMIFSKSFQSIITLQSNNVGDNGALQLENLATGDLVDANRPTDYSLQASPGPFVHIEDVPTPAFNNRRWLNNHLNMGSANILKKIGGDLELKANFSYLNDHINKAAYSFSTIYLPGQPVSYTEQVRNSNNNNTFTGNITLLRNNKSNYLKNDFTFKSSVKDDLGQLNRDDIGAIMQDAWFKSSSFTNRFGLITRIGKQLLTVTSYIDYKNEPQTLFVSPGQFPDILNDSLYYSRIIQDARLKTLFTDNAVSAVKGLGAFSFIPKIGFILQRQTLLSGLYKDEYTDGHKLGANFTNNFQYQYFAPYAEGRVLYKKNKLSIDLKSLFTFRHYESQDKIRNSINKISRVIIEPDILALYRINDKWEMTSSINYRRRYTGIDYLFNSYLLSSYNNIQKFNGILSDGSNWQSSVAANYKNSLLATFIGFGYSNLIENRNYLFRNYIDTLGFTTTEMTGRKNGRISHLGFVSYSKFLRSIRILLKSNLSVSYSRADYLFEDVQDKLKTATYTVMLGLNSSSRSWLNCDYETRLLFSRNTLSNRMLTDVFTNSHRLNVDISFIKQHSLGTLFEYYFTNVEGNKNQAFLDLRYRITFPKKRMDLIVTCTNITNSTTYARLYNSQFYIIQNYFQLRPRQLLATVKFSF